MKVYNDVLKDLQRRLDCTVGKPSSFVKAGQARPLTVVSRLSRLENMVGHILTVSRPR